MTVTLERPRGHEEVLDRLLAVQPDAASGATRGLAHALVFAGPAGVGKFAAARWWAARLKCSAACGGGAACRDCKLVASGSHPDVTVVAPGPDSDSIAIDSVRDLVRMMTLRPLGGGPRIGIVRDAHRLTPPAQSAMLKLLEEPPGFALLVLVTDNLATLLATIRSRCQTIRFGSLAAEAIRDLLVARGRTPDEARRAAALAGGSAGRALGLTDEVIADRERLITAYEELRSGASGDVEALAAELVDRRKAARPALETLLEWQVSKVERRLGRAQHDEDERLAPLLAAAADDDSEQLLAEAARTLWAMRALDRNGNPRMVMRDMLLDARPR